MNPDLSALIALGRRAFEENDLDRAEALIREAVEGGAQYADLYHTLGLVCSRQNRLEDAVAWFEKSLAVNPAYTEALLSLSITLNEMGRYEEAREAYRRADASVTPAGEPGKGNLFRGKIANLHAELGELYLALGQYEDAVREYRQSLRVAPDYPDLRVRLAIALREAGKPEEALEEAGQVLSTHPGNVSALIQTGILHFLAGRKAEARRAWDEALYRDPLNKLVRLYLNTLDRETTGGKG